MKRAPFLKRFAAVMIDYLMVSLFMYVAVFVYVGFSPSRLVEFMNSTESMGSIIISVLISVVFAFKDIVFGDASLGKKIFGLRVVNKADGARPRLYKLIIRNITLVMPFLWIIEIAFSIMDDKRRLGDRIGETVVISV